MLLLPAPLGTLPASEGSPVKVVAIRHPTSVRRGLVTRDTPFLTVCRLERRRNRSGGQRPVEQLRAERRQNIDCLLHVTSRNRIARALQHGAQHVTCYMCIHSTSGCHDYIENSKHFFIECVCYNQARVVMTTKLRNILQSFGFNHDISDHDDLLFLIFHGVDTISHGLPVKINELIYYCVVNFMSQAKRFVKKKLIAMQL